MVKNETPFKSVLKSIPVSGFLGGIVVAIAAGVISVLNETSYYYGTSQMWMWFFMVAEFMWGVVIGGVLSALLGAIKPNGFEDPDRCSRGVFRFSLPSGKEYRGYLLPVYKFVMSCLSKVIAIFIDTF